MNELRENKRSIKLDAVESVCGAAAEISAASVLDFVGESAGEIAGEVIDGIFDGI